MLINQHKNLILSAFGCGSYGNPPEQISKIFKDVIYNDFSGHFDNIVFAILDDHNSYREHNPNGNLKPFLNEFNLCTNCGKKPKYILNEWCIECLAKQGY